MKLIYKVTKSLPSPLETAGKVMTLDPSQHLKVLLVCVWRWAFCLNWPCFKVNSWHILSLYKGTFRGTPQVDLEDKVDLALTEIFLFTSVFNKMLIPLCWSRWCKKITSLWGTLNIWSCWHWTRLPVFCCLAILYKLTSYLIPSNSGKFYHIPKLGLWEMKAVFIPLLGRNDFENREFKDSRQSYNISPQIFRDRKFNKEFRMHTDLLPEED